MRGGEEGEGGREGRQSCASEIPNELEFPLNEKPSVGGRAREKEQRPSTGRRRGKKAKVMIIIEALLLPSGSMNGRRLAVTRTNTIIGLC